LPPHIGSADQVSAQLKGKLRKTNKVKREISVYTVSPLGACLERRNIKQRNGEKHRNRKGIHVYNRGKKNAGILEDLVFGTKEYKQHRNRFCVSP
jgi:hypothetical protein